MTNPFERNLPPTERPFHLGSERVVYENPWTQLVERDLTYDSGACGLYAYLKKADGVAIVPVHSDGRMTLLRTYRVPIDAWSLEFPMGAIDPGETPAQAAQRELEEEAGLCAGHLEPMGSVYNASGICDVTTYLFLASDLKEVPPRREQGEAMVRLQLTREELNAEIEELGVCQALTALLAAKLSCT